MFAGEKLALCVEGGGGGEDDTLYDHVTNNGSARGRLTGERSMGDAGAGGGGADADATLSDRATATALREGDAQASTAVTMCEC